MNKAELEELILETVKKQLLQLYRRSKRHPLELALAQQKGLTKTIADPTTWFVPVKEPERRYQTRVLGTDDFELPPTLKNYLNRYLIQQKNNKVARSVLLGNKVSKKDALSLAYTLMSIKGFPVQQPRKLMNLLILLAVENSK